MRSNSRLEVEGVERDVEPVGDAPSVAGVDGRAATLLVVGPGVGLVGVRAGPHEQADDVVPLFLEQHGRRRAIDAAGHRQDDPTGHGTPHSLTDGHGEQVGRSTTVVAAGLQPAE